MNIYPKNAVAFFGKRNLWQNTVVADSSAILETPINGQLLYLKQYAPFCPASFSLSPDRNFQGQALAQILRLSRKIKTKCIFRV
jgi:hypothetical protein